MRFSGSIKFRWLGGRRTRVVGGKLDEQLLGNLARWAASFRRSGARASWNSAPRLKGRFWEAAALCRLYTERPLWAGCADGHPAPIGGSRMPCTGNLTCRFARTPRATARITAPPTSLSCAATPSTSPDATPPRGRSRSN